jgi:hypothetical protein
MVLAIDIGLAGAVAVIAESGELIEIHDMPTLEDGPRNRATINAPLLAAIVAKSCAARAYVEWVGPRPADGAVQAFAFGRCKTSSRGFWPSAAFLWPS